MNSPIVCSKSARIIYFPYKKSDFLQILLNVQGTAASRSALEMVVVLTSFNKKVRVRHVQHQAAMRITWLTGAAKALGINELIYFVKLNNSVIKFLIMFRASYLINQLIILIS